MVRMVLLLIVFIIASPTVSAQDTPRKRVAYRGLVLPKAHAPAKWAVGKSVVQEATQGDLFLIETNVQSNERQAIAIYVWAVPLKEGDGKWVEDGQAFRVQASSRGKEWGYESSTFKSVGAFTMTSNTSSQQETRQIQLFLPFEAMSLPAGQNLEIRYELAITVGPEFLDKFFISQTFRRIVVPPQTFREEIKVIKRDSMLEFILIGAEDDTPDV